MKTHSAYMHAVASGPSIAARPHEDNRRWRAFGLVLMIVSMFATCALYWAAAQAVGGLMSGAPAAGNTKNDGSVTAPSNASRPSIRL
jgi:hypothetical protein